MKDDNEKRGSFRKKALLIILIIVVAIITFSLLFFAEDFRLGGGDGPRYQIVEQEPMYFDENGEPAEAGWIDDSNGEHLYYCTGEGKLATGWKYLEKKVWYFYQKEDVAPDRKLGALARSYTTAGKFEIPESGCFEGDDALTMAYGIDVLNRYGWDLKSAYQYSAGLKFKEMLQLDENTLIHEAALIGFETGEGNCMVWSGTFCVLAKLLGNDCRLVWGTLEWYGTRHHAWTEIWPEGEDEPHVYDPRKHEGKDFAGFDVHYGDEGSYRYNEDSRIYLEW